MSDLRRRVRQMEKAHGPRGPWCECPGPTIVLWPDGDPVRPFCGTEPEPEPEPRDEVCERCGRPIRTIVLLWPEQRGGAEADDA